MVDWLLLDYVKSKLKPEPEPYNKIDSDPPPIPSHFSKKDHVSVTTSYELGFYQNKTGQSNISDNEENLKTKSKMNNK